jgi:metal-sulfur cluster biosynthetic enzyme
MGTAIPLMVRRDAPAPADEAEARGRCSTPRRLAADVPPALRVQASGGRDLWSAPQTELPEHLLAATWAALNEVLDPELPISLVELGLVYGLELEGGVAKVALTFTATACPCMEFIREDITARLEAEQWIERVSIEEVRSPPWTSDRITPEGRAKLKALGVRA